MRLLLSLQHASAAASALYDLARDPSRLDRVLALGEAVNLPIFEKVWNRFQSDPEGRKILAERPLIDSAHVDFDALEALPDESLGREYVRFLRANGITPDVFRPPPATVDPRAAYLVQRIRQTHDLWHVVTGYKPDIPGEILLQAFTFAQLRAPSAFLIMVLGTLRHRVSVRSVRQAHARGRRARFLGTVRWEQRWANPVAALREELDCPLAPAGLA